MVAFAQCAATAGEVVVGACFWTSFGGSEWEAVRDRGEGGADGADVAGAFGVLSTGQSVGAEEADDSNEA